MLSFDNPAVRVLLHLAAAAECRYFYGFRTCHDMDDLKTPADDAAAAENFSHLLRRGIGGDIEVFRLYTQQHIPDRPTYDIGFESFLLQRLTVFSAAN